MLERLQNIRGVWRPRRSPNAIDHGVLILEQHPILLTVSSLPRYDRLNGPNPWAALIDDG
jgi:hypothetical protein